MKNDRSITHSSQRLVRPKLNYNLAITLGLGITLVIGMLFSLGFANEFPVGVVTALCGSPVFIWLLYQRQSSRI